MGSDKEIIVLECLRDVDGPMGSWNLTDKLEQRGIYVSTATLGRLLKSLERKGAVKKVGNRGRMITEAGVQALSGLRVSSHFKQHSKMLEQLITTTVLDDYIDVLEARKALERATARFAAQYITDGEIAAMEAILREQERRHREGNSIAQADIDFHRAIAHASRNKVMEAQYLMLFSYGQQTTIFEYIRGQVDAVYMTSHLQILEALKLHDPELAEQRMISHMESLIEDVCKFWDKFYGGRDSRPRKNETRQADVR